MESMGVNSPQDLEEEAGETGILKISVFLFSV